MSWKNNLQSASFRDVPFKVEGHAISGGRRVKETERWQKRTLTTDMGPLLPVFSITAYVIQSGENSFDYFNNRDKLINVLQNNTDNDKYNVGTLIHPYFGRRRVHAASYTISEHYGEGGIARFEIEFLLEEDELFPGNITNPAAKMDTTVLKANALVMDNFIKTMKTASSFVESLGTDAIFGMMKVGQAINSVNNVLKSSMATATGILGTAMNTLTSVLDSPCELYDTLDSGSTAFQHLCGMGGTIVQGGVIGGCSGTARGNQIKLDGTSIPESLGQSIIKQIIDAQDYDEDDLSIGSADQDDNRALLIDAQKYQLLSFATRVFVRTDFSSKQQLYDYLDRLLSAFDDLLLRLGDQVDMNVTDIYTATEILRAEVAELMLIKVNTLQNEITYTAGNIPISTLELAYNLYENIDRCSEIFNKNKLTIKHPGFVPENTDILVLES
jgi:prophage DNA circulation protein